MKKRILTVGCNSMDFVMNMKRLPLAGEVTVEDGGCELFPGGRGVAAAVAAARLSAESVLCTRLGADTYGARLKKICEDAGVDVRYMTTDRARRTGFSAVMEEEDGTRRTAYWPGANPRLSGEDAEEAFGCCPDALLVQMDVPDGTVADACSLAEDQGIPVFLDGSPAKPGFPFYKTAHLGAFIVDDRDAQAYSGIFPDSLDNCLKCCVRLSSVVSADYYILKLGGRGAFLYDGSYCRIVPAPQEPPAVDMRCAHEVFAAAAAAEYLRCKNMLRAVKYASAAAALCACVRGAVSSIPTDAQTTAYAEKYGMLGE